MVVVGSAGEDQLVFNASFGDVNDSNGARNRAVVVVKVRRSSFFMINPSEDVAGVIV